MRKEVHYIIYAHIAVILFLVYQTFDLITLLYDDSFQSALLDSELNPLNEADRPQLIPKIIHQTYKTTEIPEIWKAGQQRCIDLHPDYQYILWTDEMSRDFIAEEYPWFLKTFDTYQYPIERADAIRYFVLSHFGGIYIDLDDGCARKLDPLLTVPAFVRKTIPTGISNDVMGSVPKHPFFSKAIDSLNKYNNNWFVPYITIMYSTGPLFLSVIWKQYKRWGVPAAGAVRILLPQDYKSGDNPFFEISKGSSWHMDDAKFLFMLSNHIVLAVIGGFLIAFTFFFLEYLLYCFAISATFKKFTKGVWNIMRFKSWSSGRNYTRLNSRKQAKYLKTRNRKDSNLPSAINIDIEKNVLSVEEQQL
ncbi:glycosyltransferase family 32 protein [[Candida] arabinofermentans NRRL YB-2248]|uniref:inositol phosphorylceramide mannosyltransferase n=1 Tax=[Candida] arabinofermentans NRRL YB-2248 TaxID=983967 RepID=A0A1E4T645_9ASCO|nr:glycosyltransferase family 32 protein [[Candida] arabinofermentans NRRL YB-2248]